MKDRQAEETKWRNQLGRQLRRANKTLEQRKAERRLLRRELGKKVSMTDKQTLAQVLQQLDLLAELLHCEACQNVSAEFCDFIRLALKEEANEQQ